MNLAVEGEQSATHFTAPEGNKSLSRRFCCNTDSLTHTILDFGFWILDWGSLAQQGFSSASCRVLCFNRD
jgi:hypothetical protein